MTVGIPKAYLYYRYQHLWEGFFRALDLEVVTSGGTDRALVEAGNKVASDEGCLPLKIYLGHVARLRGKCDMVFVPRLKSRGQFEEYCIRFFGITDTVQSTFPDLPVLSMNLDGKGRQGEEKAFLSLGRRLGHRRRAADAYRAARWTQDAEDERARVAQFNLMQTPGTKILLAGQPYLLHDAYTSGPILRTLHALGAQPVFSDRFYRKACRDAAEELTPECFWLINKEISGAIAQYRHEVDGVILLSAFPCGNDALTSEMILRRTGDVPMIKLMLDDQQGEAGMQTRLESFMDMMAGRRVANG
ncbi:MAG: acyl-CoA dehydratase activase-related protein [Oscillospiraceae bacterium]|nr:acyl-CoA dehydratase activase-related protein [Oscillospiraceae bacterium]